MKKFSELVKKLTVVGNDYVPIIDSQAESDADKNKATLFSTILTYLRGETIRNTGTVTDEGMYALDAVQNNPNIGGTLANRLKYMKDVISQAATINSNVSGTLNATFYKQGRVCTCSGSINLTAAVSSGTNLFALPSGFAPAAGGVSFLAMTTAGDFVFLSSGAGNIGARGAMAAKTYYFSFSYIANS